MNQYNDIAYDYVETTKNEISRKYIEDPNMLERIGSVSGLDILGVGCGDGYLERLLKKMGARYAVGTDASYEMLELARAAETADCLGITYLLHDLSTLPQLGEFDLVTAKYVLNYTSNRQELLSMCLAAWRNLKPDGRLVALVPDYADDESGLPHEPKYGFTAEALSLPLTEGGDKLKITLHGGDSQVSFVVGFWKPASYREALERTGFRKITFHKLLPSPEGIAEYGEEFWAEWVARPYSTIIEAWK